MPMTTLSIAPHDPFAPLDDLPPSLMCCLQLRCQVRKDWLASQAKKWKWLCLFSKAALWFEDVWSLKWMLNGDQPWDLGVPLMDLQLCSVATCNHPRGVRWCKDYHVYEGMRQYLWDRVPVFYLLYMAIANCCTFGELVHYNVKFARQALTKHA